MTRVDLAPTFLDNPDAKGPFRRADTARFVLVDGDEPMYREVERARSVVDPYA